MARNKEMSASELDAKLKEFETNLKRLYRLYEQYFIGVENRPPRTQRRQLERLYRQLDQVPMLKTSHKFRFRNLVQRYNSYKSYWNRTERQIEQGTYHRDVARAKARQKRREEQEAESERPQEDDDAIELDETELEELDLDSLEEELRQMDERGEFEKYVGTAKLERDDFPEDREAPRAEQEGETPNKERERQNSWKPPEVDEEVKKKRLSELQEKLGLSTRGTPSEADGGQRAAEFDRSSEGPTQKARPENPAAPGRGADISKLRKLRKAKEHLERKKRGKRTVSRRDTGGDEKGGERSRKESGSNRVIRRGSSSGRGGSSSPKKGGSREFPEEKSRKIYNSLVEAKRRCNEDTSNLNYDSFKRSMERQRTKIQKKKNARDVDFKVVIKDGRAFLKPETKK